MEMQKIIWDDILNGLQSEVLEKRMSGVLLICGKRMRETDIGRRLRKMPFVVAVFSDFEPNPTYEAVLQALNMFEKNRCDAIMALGGGSAIDIAKCVKAFYGMDGSVNFLNQNILPNKIPLVAVPSTAGTGSEATSFAVIYFEGIKYSVADASLMPGLVLMEASLLRTLPAYQKKVTMLDAFCHCVESYWSNNAGISKNMQRTAFGTLWEIIRRIWKVTRVRRKICCWRQILQAGRLILQRRRQLMQCVTK